MIKNNLLKIFVLTVATVLFAETAFPCSMYKVTSNGKTMVGNNEDSWGRDARIWFEQGTNGKSTYENVAEFGRLLLLLLMSGRVNGRVDDRRIVGRRAATICEF